MNAHELTEAAKEAQEIMRANGLDRGPSALDPDPQILQDILKTKTALAPDSRLLFDLIKQAERPEIQYFLRQQQVDEEAMERFLRDQTSRTDPKEFSLHILIAVDEEDKAS